MLGFSLVYESISIDTTHGWDYKDTHHSWATENNSRFGSFYIRSRFTPWSRLSSTCPLYKTLRRDPFTLQSLTEHLQRSMLLGAVTAYASSNEVRGDVRASMDLRNNVIQTQVLAAACSKTVHTQLPISQEDWEFSPWLSNCWVGHITPSL